MISADEYKYFKSLEEAIKHPERYSGEDPDYLTPEEIILAYETNKKLNGGDFSGFVDLDDYVDSSRLKEKKFLL